MDFKIGTKVKYIGKPKFDMHYGYIGTIIYISQNEIGISHPQGHHGINWPMPGWYVLKKEIVLDKSDQFKKDLFSLLGEKSD